jgi:hypothetical protein
VTADFRRCHSLQQLWFCAATAAPGGIYVKELKERFEVEGCNPNPIYSKKG